MSDKRCIECVQNVSHEYDLKLYQTSVGAEITLDCKASFLLVIDGCCRSLELNVCYFYCFVRLCFFFSRFIKFRGIPSVQCRYDISPHQFHQREVRTVEFNQRLLAFAYWNSTTI